MEKEMITGSIGTAVGVVGTSTQTNELLQTISLIITIIGAIITYIIVPTIVWYTKAKKDGKITKEEIKEGKEILVNGISKIKKSEEDKK